MAPLPPDRCTFTVPFQTTGIDYAGPFELKSSTLKKAAILKGYVCVFVCFSTKAIHLEVCSDLSTAAFRAAFSRFVGRRGLPYRLYSDNGRNFVGANRQLKREFEKFIESTSKDTSQKYSTNGFEWIFIPPHAPHMGGLWEAAVKSFKFHLKRVAGSYRFTYEEFSTILSQIEGILNSRPISAISEDPTYITALTPGHFLRGAPIMSFPEQHNPRIGLVNRWEKLKVIHHQFAIRWKEDYLKSLHKRYKWKDSCPNLRIGDLVVVMDDLFPPSEWRLGRIVRIYSSSDNNVRVADIKTATGIITRPIIRLCYLPLLNDEDLPIYSSRHTRKNQMQRRDPEIYQCKICRRFHSIRFCKRFLNMDARSRNKIVQKYRYCTNCLAKSHDMRACPCIDTCRICGEWHHTLLHPGIKGRLSLRKPRTVQRVSRQQTMITTSRQSAAQRHSAASSARSTRPRRSPAPSTSSSAQRSSSSGPNKQILSEAIRSLAEVLCVKPE